ncbi:MAG: arginine--tRNA ligase, partial [Vicingaceae bacterium]
MEKILFNKVVEGLKHLYDADVDEKQIQIQQTRKDFAGDLTVIVFPFLKASKKGPEQTAEDLGAYIKENTKEVEAFNVVKGFLNFSITADYWIAVFNKISSTNNYGHSVDSGKTVMVEYCSPNTNKPLHLG